MWFPSGPDEFRFVRFHLRAATMAAIYARGSGRRILLIHGNSSCKEIWINQVVALSGAGHTVIAPDLPGHGQSGNARDARFSYSFPGYGKTVSELLDHLGWSSVDVVGWSLGGHIGLELLATDDRVSSLVIVGAPPARLSPRALGEAFYPTPTMMLAGKASLSTSEARAYAAAMLGDTALVRPHFERSLLRTDGKARWWMFRNAMKGVGADQREVVERTKKPVCVIHGEQEAFVRLEYLESVQYRELWSGRVQVIRGAGHAPHWQCPRTFNETLLDFLG